MGIRTLLGYLVGNRAAILALAAHPHAWVVGLVFVLSAGFAREYDGEDLLHDPWYLFLPLAASLVSSFLLFGVLFGVSLLYHKEGPSFFWAYRSFLSLFWFTAPLAWLYAIPYERLLDPVSATYANLWTLAIVSAWRVALMVRVGVVLMGLSPWAALFRVVAFADGAALLALAFLPFPIIEIMGGMRLTEAEAAVRSAAQFVGCCGGVSFLIWVLLASGSGNKTCWRIPTDRRATQPKISWPLRAAAFASLAVWVDILPFAQPEQQLRRRVEASFHEGCFADGLAQMSAHSPGDFPPHWDPPPRFLKGENMALVLDIWKEILGNDPAPWVSQCFLEKLKIYVELGPHYWDGEKVATLLNQVPEAESWLQAWAADSRHGWLREILDPHLRPDLRMKKKADGS
jgi:hypothetical protein